MMMHASVISIVAADTLVLKHQVISSHNAWHVLCIVTGQFQTKIHHYWKQHYKLTLYLNNTTQCLGVK